MTEFLQAEAPLTKGANGQRAQLSGKYAYNRQIQLRKFAATFPNTAVCDLSKEHLDAFLGCKHSRNVSAKSRNHYRAAVRQFLQWAVRKDYLDRNPSPGRGGRHAPRAWQHGGSGVLLAARIGRVARIGG